MTRNELIELLKTASDKRQNVGATHLGGTFVCNSLLMLSDGTIDADIVELASQLYNASPDLLKALQGFVEAEPEKTWQTNPYNGKKKKNNLDLDDYSSEIKATDTDA